EKIPKWIQVIYPVTFFSFSMFMFRAKPTVGFATSIDTAFFMIKRAMTGAGGTQMVLPVSVYVLMAILFTTEALRSKGENVYDPIFKHKWVLYGMTAATLIVCGTIYSVTVSAPFLYFAF